MILISIVFLGFSLTNAHTAKAYESRADAAFVQYNKKLHSLEKEYHSFFKEQDISTTQESSKLLKDFEEEPKLYDLLSKITQAVPPGVVITKIEVKRPEIKPQTQTREVQKEEVIRYSTSTNNFTVAIEGTIHSSYPKSREIFLSFLSGINKIYPGGKANFNYDENKASFNTEFEAKK